MNLEAKGWLTALGEQERRVVSSYGRGTSEAKAAELAWSEAYYQVLFVRRCYGLSSANSPHE